jgi:UDP-glucose:O-linked fucose beta-1,3-glucosyltransferase
VSRELEKNGSEKNDLTSKIEELDLYNDSSERELKKIITSKQDLMVDQNILKLELKRLRDMLNERADEVFTLEKRRLQLETVSSCLLYTNLMKLLPLYKDNILKKTCL